MATPVPLCCTHPGCGRARLAAAAGGVRCPNGHFFPFLDGTDIPVFVTDPPRAGEYANRQAAEVHDNALRWVFATFGVEEPALRRRLVDRLGLLADSRVLVTGAGAGNDLPYLAEALGGRGEIHAQDIAAEMLLEAARRHRAPLVTPQLALNFSLGDASCLPFADGAFDAAYHFGGINLFPDVRQGLAEMARVVRVGGRVVVGDEGIAPWLREGEMAAMLVRNNPLYAHEVPLAQLPGCARDVTVSWELGLCFWVVSFSVANGPPAIDIDVPHVGTRGGTIRTRYFGQLEGIEPALRDRLNEEARRTGRSRVELLELLLRKGLGEP